MSVNKVNLLIFTLSYLFLESQGLEKLLANRFEVIVIADKVIRKTTAKIFAELQLNIRSQRLKQALLVHNYFTSVSLKDVKTLNFIYEITRVDRLDNDTERYTTALNEALNEELNNIDLNSPETNEENIVQYFDEFLTNLNNFKESGIDEGYENLDIKKEIINILKSDDPAQFNPLSQKLTTKPYPRQNVYVSDEEFWIPNDGTRRVYQGKRAKIKYFPFMASIHILKAFQCAGSIIKSDLIVTAASCLQLAWNNRFFHENPAFLSVRVGSTFYHGGGEEIPVLEVYFNPGYNPRNLQHNIAVLRLLRHLKFRKRSRKLKKIAIDVNDAPLPLTTDGVTILGWGARSASNIVGNAWSNQLSFAVLDVYHLQECQEIYTKEYVTKTNFCAGFVSKGGGACNHDVGGPGVVNGVLVGIISFGSPVCGTPEAPTVFTKVGYYAEWIEEVMEQEVSQRGARTTLQYTRLFPDTTQMLDLSLKKGFVITPLVTPTPIPLKVADALRIRFLQNEQLFKEFLSTIFKSKDASDFKALFHKESISEDDKELKEKTELQTLKQLLENLEKSDEDQNKEEEIHEKSNEKEGLHELDTRLGYHTVMDYLDSEEKKRREIVKKQHRFTVFSKDDDEKDETIEQSTVKLTTEVEKVETEDKPEAQDDGKKDATIEQSAVKLITEIDKEETKDNPEAQDDGKEDVTIEQSAVKLITEIDKEETEDKPEAQDDGTEDVPIEQSTVKLITEIDKEETEDKPEAQDDGKEDVTIEKTTIKLITEGDKEETKNKPTQEFKPGDKREMGVTKAQDTKPNLGLLETDITTVPMKVEPTNKRENIKKALKSKKKKAKQEEDLFTLLYMTDYDTNNSTLDEINNAIEYLVDDSSAGLPIEPKSYIDNTYRTNNTTELSNIANDTELSNMANDSPKLSVLDFISKSELYDLLSEAIDEVANYENVE